MGSVNKINYQLPDWEGLARIKPEHQDGDQGPRTGNSLISILWNFEKIKACYFWNFFKKIPINLNFDKILNIKHKTLNIKLSKSCTTF